MGDCCEECTHVYTCTYMYACIKLYPRNICTAAFIGHFTSTKLVKMPCTCSVVVFYCLCNIYYCTVDHCYGYIHVFCKIQETFPRHTLHIRTVHVQV